MGNKSDLEHNRAVPNAHGQQKKRNTPNCVMFTETSVVNDLNSIQALF